MDQQDDNFNSDSICRIMDERPRSRGVDERYSTELKEKCLGLPCVGASRKVENEGQGGSRRRWRKRRSSPTGRCRSSPVFRLEGEPCKKHPAVYLINLPAADQSENTKEYRLVGTGTQTMGKILPAAGSERKAMSRALAAPIYGCLGPHFGLRCLCFVSLRKMSPDAL